MENIVFFLQFISNIRITFLIIVLIIIFHICLFIFRDLKYLKAFLVHQDPDNVSLKDLKDIPIVTIVVPAWNQGTNFRNCLKSIHELSYPNLKVIVNAGGSQETISIANDYKKYKNFKIIYEQGGGKIKALNKCLPYISEGLVYLIDADVYLTDEILLRMIHPIINLNQNVVMNGIRPLKEQENKDLAKYLQINRNRYFKVKFKRYLDRAISGANTIVTSEVIKAVGQFSENKTYAEDRSRGEDIRSKGFKIYSLIDYRSRLYSEIPDSLKKWINQKIRWNGNFLIYAFENRKRSLIKFMILFINSLLLIFLPFFLFLNFGFFIFSMFLLLNLYCIKIRRTIFKIKSVKKEYRNRMHSSFYLKLIFYIIIEAIITIYILFDLIFTNKHSKRKNLDIPDKSMEF